MGVQRSADDLLKNAQINKVIASSSTATNTMNKKQLKLVGQKPDERKGSKKLKD